MLYYGIDAIDENHDHELYVDSQCHLRSEVIQDVTCRACSGSGPSRRGGTIEHRRSSRRRGSSSCTEHDWPCYRAEYTVDFRDGGVNGSWVRNAKSIEPVHARALSDSSCDTCRADPYNLLNQFPGAVGSDNVTVPCHYSKDDPAGTVVLDLVDTSTGTIITYFAVAIGLGLIFGGVGLVLCCGLCVRCFNLVKGEDWKQQSEPLIVDEGCRYDTGPKYEGMQSHEKVPPFPSPMRPPTPPLPPPPPPLRQGQTGISDVGFPAPDILVSNQAVYAQDEAGAAERGYGLADRGYNI